MIGHPITEQQWRDLTGHAIAAASHAYVPYSHYNVGAAAWDQNGRLFTGCNVENASYGLTLCAECGLVSNLVANDGGKLSAFVCVDKNGQIIVPCGRCRQLLREHAAVDFEAMMPKGPITMNELLPDSFGPEWLEGN